MRVVRPPGWDATPNAVHWPASRLAIYRDSGLAGLCGPAITRPTRRPWAAVYRPAVPIPPRSARVPRTSGDEPVDDHLSGQRERFADRILPRLRDPAEVWLTAVTDPQGRTAYRRRFITAFDGGRSEENTVAITQEDKNGSLSWTFYPARAVDGLQKGFLLYRRPAP